MPDPSAPSSAPRAGARAAAADERPRPASVLLVDDRPENLAALEAVLEPLGHRLVRAGSAEEALRHVLHEQFAVILLDVQMPGTDGLETARLIKQRVKSEHVPIIFLTALDADRRRMTLAYESGAVDYLFKPFDPDVLRAKVAAFVELDRLRAALAVQESRRFADRAVRESEERFRLVQQATNDVIWDWDLVTGGLRWNELAGEVFRVPADEIPNDVRWWFEHIHPDDRDRVVSGIHAVIEGEGGGTWSAEYRLRLGEGSFRTFLDRGHVACDAEGRPVRMIGAMQDVTERTRARADAEAARAAAEQARQAAEEASRLKSEFLATMSHEFRTPLNAILGYAQLLDMGVLGPATPAQHAHLERLQASARHLLRLVDDVLDVAKVDADRLTVRHDPLVTGAAVAAAVTLVQPQATAKGVRLVAPGASTPGVPFVGDEHRVRQILVNLLSNAVKFTPPGRQVTIACGSAAEPDPGAQAAGATGADAPPAWAFVRIEDTGPGIAPELLSRLFEPFVQGDSALTREQGGTGLGLAISRRLARLMEGDITVWSSPGAGAAFTLWLPLATQATVTSAGTFTDGRPSRRTPAGLPGIAASSGAAQHDALDAASYAVLHALSVRLSADADTVAERYVAALRADGRFPGARELPAVQLRAHVAPLIGLLASHLMVIGETLGQAPELLGDSGQVQRLMAELHGAQRHRLGWAEADVERETAFLQAEVERAIRGAVDTAAAAGVVGPGDGESSAAAVQAATRYAIDVTGHVIEQATRTALRAYRFAKASAGP